MNEAALPGAPKVSSATVVQFSPFMQRIPPNGLKIAGVTPSHWCMRAMWLQRGLSRVINPERSCQQKGDWYDGRSSKSRWTRWGWGGSIVRCSVKVAGFLPWYSDQGMGTSSVRDFHCIWALKQWTSPACCNVPGNEFGTFKITRSCCVLG